jgi:hypothetical protein
VPEDANTIYYDADGLIVQRDQDGGDTAQREGWYWFGRALVQHLPQVNDAFLPERRLTYEQVLAQLEVGQTGIFRRHPHKWNNPDDFTRDQTIPLVAAMGYLGDAARLQRFYHELRRRNWFAQNMRDEMGTPFFRNFIRRARDEEPDRLTDAAFIAGAVQARIDQCRGNMDDVGDDLNLVVILAMEAARKPNAEADAARLYYTRNRPDNYGMFLGTYRRLWGTDWSGATRETMKGLIDDIKRSGQPPDCPRILGALRWYFRAESGGCPGLAELYRPIIREWFQ